MIEMRRWFFTHWLLSLAFWSNLWSYGRPIERLDRVRKLGFINLGLFEVLREWRKIERRRWGLEPLKDEEVREGICRVLESENGWDELRNREEQLLWRKMGENGSFKQNWSKWTRPASKDLVDRIWQSTNSGQLWKFTENQGNFKKNIWEHAKIPNIPKKNLVKFLAWNTISRYI